MVGTNLTAVNIVREKRLVLLNKLMLPLLKNIILYWANSFHFGYSGFSGAYLSGWLLQEWLMA